MATSLTASVMGSPRGSALAWVVMLVSACAAPRPVYVPSHEDYATPSLTEFARVVEFLPPDEKSRRFGIQTAVRRLVHPETGTRITLLAMSHLGTAAYFRNLTPHLFEADLVITEGWSPEVRQRDFPEELTWVERFQEALAKLLNLRLQRELKDTLDERPWHCVDAPWEETARLLEGGETLLGPQDKRYVEELEAWLELPDEQRDPVATSQARLWAWRYFLFAVGGIRKTELYEHSRFQSFRDEHIFQGVRDVLSGARGCEIVLVYGFEHCWVLEPRLVRELGFRLGSTAWRDVASYVETEQVAEVQQSQPHRFRWPW